MSNITNNLIVLTKDCQSQFLRSFEDFKDRFALGNLLEEYVGEEYVAYSFDCNGDNPWYMYSCKHGYFKVNIIDYLDGDDLLITTCDDSGKIREIDEYWSDVLEKYLPQDVIDSLVVYFSA